MKTVKRAADGGLSLSVAEPARVLPALLILLQALSVKLLGLTTRTATLEDVFVTLTGRHLRDTE